MKLSNIGNKYIVINKNSQLKYNNNIFYIKGLYGIFKIRINSNIKLKLFNKDRLYILYRSVAGKYYNFNLWGTYRTLIQNILYGLSYGNKQKLNIIGWGYKSLLIYKVLFLSIGFSHILGIKVPNNIILTSTDKRPYSLVLYGSDKINVNYFTNVIRLLKIPDVYKGKGIIYENEIIKLKEGKESFDF